MDEADLILEDLTLKDDIDAMLKTIATASSSRLVYVSATITPAVNRLSAHLERPQPKLLTPSGPGMGEKAVYSTPSSLRHIALPMVYKTKDVQTPQAMDALIVKRLAQVHAALEPKGVMLVFVKDEAAVEGMLEGLRSRKFSCAALTAHHPKERKARAALLRKVKTNRVQVVLATEMGARGLDLAGVHTVVNLTPPKDVRQYIHRAGRAARMSPVKGPVGEILDAGAEAPVSSYGVSVTFVPQTEHSAADTSESIDTDHLEKMRILEKSLGATVEWVEIVGGGLQQPAARG